MADELEARRPELAAATDDTISAACTATLELAMRAATILFTATDSRSVLPETHAGRLAREALLLLVFASRPTVKQALLDRLSVAH